MEQNFQQKMHQIIDMMNDEQAEFLYAAISHMNHLSKGDLMKMVYTEEQYKKVDSSYPTPYADQIRQVLPSWNGIFNCYDYNENKFGSMTNLAEKFVSKFQQIFKTL